MTARLRRPDLGEVTRAIFPDCSHGALRADIQGAEIVKLLWDKFNCTEMTEEFEKSVLYDYTTRSYSFRVSMQDPAQGSTFKATMEGNNDEK